MNCFKRFVARTLRNPIIIAGVLLVAIISGCGTSSKMLERRIADPVEIRIYIAPLQSVSDVDMAINNIREIASYRDTIRNSPVEDAEDFVVPMDVVTYIVGRIHSLRVVEMTEEKFNAHAICEVVYSDSTHEEFLIDKNGYFKYGDIFLRDSYRVLRLLGIACQVE